MKNKKTYYFKAVVTSNEERIIKNAQSRLQLAGKPYNIPDAIKHIINEYEKNLIKQ